MSFRLSMKRVICDKTKETCAHSLILHERTFILVFGQEEQLVGATPCTWNFASNWPCCSENADFNRYLKQHSENGQQWRLYVVISKTLEWMNGRISFQSRNYYFPSVPWVPFWIVSISVYCLYRSVLFWGVSATAEESGSCSSQLGPWLSRSRRKRIVSNGRGSTEWRRQRIRIQKQQGNFAPKAPPGHSIPGPRWGTFILRPLICRSLEKILLSYTHVVRACIWVCTISFIDREFVTSAKKIRES